MYCTVYLRCYGVVSECVVVCDRRDLSRSDRSVGKKGISSPVVGGDPEFDPFYYVDI
jgi:hypothetical protein